MSYKVNSGRKCQSHDSNRAFQYQKQLFDGCYELKCVSPPKFMSWTPNPAMWLYVEIGSLKRWSRLNEVLRVGPYSNSPDIITRGRDTRSARVQRKFRGDVTRNQPFWHLDCTPSLKNCEQINFFSLSHPVGGVVKIAQDDKYTGLWFSDLVPGHLILILPGCL